MRTMVVRTAAWQREGSRFKSPGGQGNVCAEFACSLPLFSPPLQTHALSIDLERDHVLVSVC